MDSKTVKMQLEGPVRWPKPRGRKRQLSFEPEGDKRRKVCVVSGQEVRPVPAGVRSQGSQTISWAIARLPVASCCSLPVPWGVQRSSSVSASTQTTSRDRPSSVDDLCDLDVELLEDDVFLMEDIATEEDGAQEAMAPIFGTATEVDGAQDAMAAILDTLVDMMQQGVPEPLTQLCSALELDTSVEGVDVTPFGLRRHVATNTTNVPTRVTTTMAPRRKAWRKASRHWHSFRARTNSATQTD